MSVPHFHDSVPAEELVGEVCSKFRISDKIGKFLAADEGLANLDDFVHRFASEDEICTFVKALYERRELVWDATTAPAPASSQPSNARGEAKPPRQDAGARRAQPGGEAQKPGDRQKDGKEVCRAWNHGKCSEPCPRGFLHVCNNIVGKGGRMCGMRNHTAAECRRKTFQQPASAAAADPGARR